ncbi:hypothetical protein HK104_004745 [Borealophlyctis nickersoniae]|nr:hypothetical protein HK104_004745 [Borealophlyctis nickersoniae]
MATSTDLADSMDAFVREFTIGCLKIVCYFCLANHDTEQSLVPWMNPAAIKDSPNRKHYIKGTIPTTHVSTILSISPPASPACHCGGTQFTYFNPDILAPPSSRILINDVICNAELVKLTVNYLTAALQKSSLTKLTAYVSDIETSIEEILKEAKREARIQRVQE